MNDPTNFAFVRIQFPIHIFNSYEKYTLSILAQYLSKTINIFYAVIKCFMFLQLGF